MDNAVNFEYENDTSTRDEGIPLPVQVKVYKRRWYILMVFSTLGFLQCAIWNTWGPITDSVKFAYNSWDDAEIGLLSMWGTITMIIGLIPLTFYLQKEGLRKSMIITATLIWGGAFIRLFGDGEKSFTIFAHIGAILNGFGGIIIGCAPSLLSSIWFPVNERTTATAVGCTFNQLGNAGGFFLGPLLVPEPEHKQNATIGNFTGPPDIATQIMRKKIRDYMWITMACCFPFLLFVLAYFPNKPKRPPSLTSAKDETLVDVLGDVKKLMTNTNFLLLLIPYSLTLGVNVAWSSVIDINVAPMGITQSEASWMGVYMTLGGVVLALVVSRFTDMLFGYIKLTIIVLTVLATLGFGWFLFIMNGCLPFSKTQLFVSCILASSFSYSVSPLFFELAVEIAYPVPEGVVGGALTLFWNLTAASFLAVLQLKFKSVLWMDYFLFFQAIIAIFFMIFVKEEYKRTNLDRNANTVSVDDDESGPLLAELFQTI